jgi:hypothetical protein
VAGGGDEVLHWLVQRLDPREAELVPSGSPADVAVVAGDEDVSALDRCRQVARELPCVVLLGASPGVDDLSAAMAAGARAVVARTDDTLTLTRAVTTAAAFARPVERTAGARAPVFVVTGAHGGAGTSTVAIALAASLPGRVALIDLDLAGGSLADVAGLTVEPSDPGLAGQASGAGAWAGLRADVGWCMLVPAPYRPELAWLVAEGLCRDTVAAAAADADAVVADAGRAAGPAIEALTIADVAVVVCTPAARSIAAAARHARVIARLAPGAACEICVAGARRADLVRLRLTTVPRGARVRLVLPRLADPVHPGTRAQAALASLARPV